MEITRRDALNRLSMVIGGAISASTLSTLLSGCRAEPTPPLWTPESMSGEEADLVAALVDLIIPPTDTPGAKDAGVPVFIDKLLADWAAPAERSYLLSGIGAIDDRMRDAHGVPFLGASEEQQGELIQLLDEQGVRARENGESPLPAFALLKELTLIGYYTSEVGATQELQWLEAPGRFDADVPLEEVGRTWA